MTKSRGIRPPRKPWTELELNLVRSEYPDTLTRDLAARLGRADSAVHAKAHVLGLRKSAAFLSGPMAHQLDGHRDNGRRFQAGQKPWCAGTKGVVGVQAGCRATQFKKGQLVGRDECRPLAITRVIYEPSNLHAVVSYWKPSAEELRLLNEGRAVYMSCWGATHPPIAIGVDGDGRL
jgi:hypothetical protein